MRSDGKNTGNAPISMTVLLLPAFNSLACNAFLDTFRAANYLHGAPLYQWEFASLKGGTVTASNGLAVAETSAFEADVVSDFTVVNASWNPERFSQKSLFKKLGKLARTGTHFIALDTGAFVLAYAGLLNGYEAVVHNEHEAAFAELFPFVDLKSELFVIDRNRISCVGGVAAIDLSLELLHQQHGLDLANAAARYVFKDRIRPGSESSSDPAFEPIGHAIPEPLRETILLMQRNLEEPLRISEVAHYGGYSMRQLERQFNRFTGISPARFYLNLRLQRAHGLLTQTERSIAEIATACGFASSEYFSKCYKKMFSAPPGQDRANARVPFHFRSNPGMGSLDEL